MKIKFILLILVLLSKASHACDLDSFCDTWIYEDLCDKIRTKKFYGDKAVYVEEQVDKISALLRESMLSRKYESLEPYLQFPFTFVVTDFRKAELRKDATGYTLEVNNMKEFRTFLIKMNKRHPRVFLEFLPESSYSKLEMNRNYISLIGGNHSYSLNISEDFSFKLDALFIEIF